MAKKAVKKEEQNAEKTKENIVEKWPIVSISCVAEDMTNRRFKNPFKGYLYKYLHTKPTNFDTHYIVIDLVSVTIKLDCPKFELHIEGIDDENDTIRYINRSKNPTCEIIARLSDIKHIIRGVKEK